MNKAAVVTRRRSSSLSDLDLTTRRSERGSKNSWRVVSDTPRLFDHNNRVLESNDGASWNEKHKKRKKNGSIFFFFYYYNFFFTK